MGSIEGVEAVRLDDVEDIVYVAVGKNVEKSEKLLLWAAKNFGTKKICVLHVHQPENVKSLNKKHLGNESIDPAIKEFREIERQEVHDLLDQYVLTLFLAGVQANKLLVEMDSNEKAIKEAIAQHKIKWLVMGATADKYLSGADRKHQHERENTLPLLFLNSNMKAKQSEKLRSEPVPKALKLIDAKDMEGIFRSFSSHCSVNSNPSLNRVIARSELTDLLFDEEEMDEGEEVSKTNHRMEQVITDGRSLRREEFGEAEEKLEAENNTMKDAFGSLCAFEMIRRKELEELLAKEKQEVQKMKNQRDELMHRLQMVKDQNLVLKSQLDDSRSMVPELEEKIVSAVELLISFREKRDKLKIEHENAVRRVKELRKFVKADTEHLYGTEFPTFSFVEINEATNEFDPSWKIGEGRYGSVYKGILRNIHVAIKMLPSYGSQSQLEFQRQVEILSRVRHPNILTLIGSCPESRSLVYEYLNNGSLADHLARKDNTPLPWQIRISIVADLCSALIFLQYSEPCIIHGNLKPSKVILDSNFVAKLGDLGFSHLVPKSEDSANNTTICKNNANESLVYLDPEYLATGKLTPESDVYSFGIILLQLLTCRPLLGLVRDVKCALEKENLTALLDFSAGEWPLGLTKQLAYLALRCCEKSWLDLPDLVSEIWSVLEPIKTSCIKMPPYLTSKKLHRAPSHFVCPIFQEVMKDPYIAADGFTYEADAIGGWLDSGHNTSPMTNLKLEHLDLVPNYALHNAIQEWQQLQ
ncbi:hypothetical protein L6164_006041 [Bauhinia variegata]|uniref:Uncharacterized protein n=1 Tax=Bauhinia variegata TaxID=167791 RepID=A0ACB9PV08_BAUVA|nr:hypothetical protein L6164_006041 [Bauhinia variegata]